MINAHGRDWICEYTHGNMKRWIRSHAGTTISTHTHDGEWSRRFDYSAAGRHNGMVISVGGGGGYDHTLEEQDRIAERVAAALARATAALGPEL